MAGQRLENGNRTHLVLATGTLVFQNKTCHNFQEILKHTPDDHPERINLEMAVEKMLEACSEVNERKREYEEIEKQTLQVQLLLEPWSCKKPKDCKVVKCQGVALSSDDSMRLTYR